MVLSIIIAVAIVIALAGWALSAITIFNVMQGEMMIQ
jgi:hypothetical protein